MKYKVKLKPRAENNFSKLDKSNRKIILKKLLQLETKATSRHLKRGLSFFVEEVKQYRIAFKVDEKVKIKDIYFIGTHKQYEKWYMELF